MSWKYMSVPLGTCAFFAEDKELGGVSEEAGFDRPNMFLKVRIEFMIIQQCSYSLTVKLLEIKDLFLLFS